MPVLSESIIEDAALIMPAASLTRPLPLGEVWELGYTIGHGPEIAPGEYAGGTLTPTLSTWVRDSYGEVVQSRVAQTLIPAFSHKEKEKRDAIRRLNPEPTVKESLSVQTKEPQP